MLKESAPLPEKIISQNPKATVYDCKDSLVIKSHHIKDPSLVSSILTELEKWKSCDHPNILQLHDFKLDEQNKSTAQISCVLEKVPMSLSDIVNERAKTHNYFTKEEYVSYCLQIIGGFVYLDKKNVSHKNLKLSNVLVTDDETLKLTDLVNPDFQDAVSAFAPFISPELRGKTVRVDTGEILKMNIWRLGMLFLELGKLCKFEDLNTSMQDINERYEKKVSKILLQMIEDDPSRRSSLKKVFDDFKKIARQLSIKDDKYIKAARPKKNGEETKSDDPKPKKAPVEKTFEVMPESEIKQYYNDEGKFGDGKITKDIFKISTWNLNSLTNVLTSFEKENNPLLNYLKTENPDFFCVTETHLKYEALNSEPVKSFLSPEYIVFHNCHKGNIGRSGVAIYTRFKPINVFYDMGIPKHDKEGRIITLEYEKFYLVGCYTPNSGRQLQRLDYRTTEWDPDFRVFLTNLAAKKNIILCGDLNVAHEKIDIHTPKRYAGYTDEERAEFTILLKQGFVDAFRHLYPKERQYTFFSSYFDAREQHKGWRLDYFVLNKEAMRGVRDVKIQKDVIGSDHCPMEMIFDQTKL